MGYSPRALATWVRRTGGVPSPFGGDPVGLPPPSITIFREPLTHWAENIGTTRFHAIIFELKQP